MKKGFSLLLLFLLIFAFLGCTEEITTSLTTTSTTSTSSSTSTDIVIEPFLFFEDALLSQSRYLPGENGQVSLSCWNTSLSDQEGYFILTLWNITEQISSVSTDSISISASQRQTIELEFQLPSEDFKGYYLEIDFIVHHTLVDSIYTAVDVSSDITHYPRYGYLTDYSDLSLNEINRINDYFLTYHINMVQFYDWQDTHQEPYVRESSMWYNIANQPVYLSTITNYIDLLHQSNILAYEYDLLYGVYQDSISQDVAYHWGLFKDTSAIYMDYHSLPSSWETDKIMLMDPSNLLWQDYFLTNMQTVFDEIDFDGWHIDQLGNRGTRYDISGNEVNMISAYLSMLDAANTRLNVSLIMNAVDGYASSELAQSSTSVLYQEVWSETTYNELKQIIDRSRSTSDFSKSIVLAAYMNYGSSNEFNLFNTSSILLTDAVIFASGGSHIELGDTGMLGNEYFPNDNLQMTNQLKSQLENYYDFLVMYEEILQFNPRSDYYSVTIEDYSTSFSGVSNSIYVIQKQTDQYRMLHLINLTNNTNLWRDDDLEKNTPEVLVNLQLSFNLNQHPTSIYLASPDQANALPISLDFTVTPSGTGYLVTLTIPTLYYWDMLIIE